MHRELLLFQKGLGRDGLGRVAELPWSTGNVLFQLRRETRGTFLHSQQRVVAYLGEPEISRLVRGRVHEPTSCDRCPVPLRHLRAQFASRPNDLRALRDEKQPAHRARQGSVFSGPERDGHVHFRLRHRVARSALGIPGRAIQPVL